MEKYWYLEICDKENQTYTDVSGTISIPAVDMFFKGTDDDLNCSICNKKLTEHTSISSETEIYQLCHNGTLCA